MIKKIMRIINYLKLKLENNISSQESIKQDLIPQNQKEMKKQLQDIFSECSDFNLREITLGKKEKAKILIASIDGLIDKDIVNRDVLKPLMNSNVEVDKPDRELFDIIKEDILAINEITEVKNLEKCINYILSGDTLIYIDGKRIALKVGTRGWEARGVDEPDTESVVRGPREGFTETLRTNTSLLRRKIKNSNLKFETMTIGRQTNTDICICYIKGLIHGDIVKTLKRRLKKINADSILESGYIEEFIEDAPLSIFPTVANSEKPDVVAGKVLEGRAAVFCEGTPFVLTVPHLFIESLLSAEDYYRRPFFSTLIRFLRVLALITTTLLPALYVAFVAFHQDVIPLKLLLTIAASREGIPFTVFTETLLMGISYELLREAGIRMPRPIGQAVSIVGALVLGQAAVEAGIASNPVVMLTALTAISSFIIPPLDGTIPIIRLLMVFAANYLGLIGISLIIVFLILHMASLRSFGIPYLAPFSPLNGMDLKDTFIRVPLWSMWFRPRSLLVDHVDKVKKGYRMKKDVKTKED
ncbi:MAG: spore germination protein [Halothermotrichaceae bacterium]